MMKSINQNSSVLSEGRLHIGLLVNEEFLKSKDLYQFIQWAKGEENLFISHLIILANEPAEKSLKRQGKFEYYLSKLLFAVPRFVLGYIAKFEAIRLRSIPDYKDHLQRFDVGSLIEKSIYVYPKLGKNSLICTFSNSDAQCISDLNLDLLISYGIGRFSSNILQCVSNGMIALEHNDGQHDYGNPPGFWEVYRRSEYTGFVIRHLTKETPTGKVLIKGRFKTEYFYLVNQAAIYRRSRQYLQNLLRHVAPTGLPLEIANLRRTHDFYPFPSVRQSLFYWMTICARITAKIFRKTLRIDYKWNIAFCNNDWRNTKLANAIRVENPKDHFLADPFVITRNNKNYCFVEDYDYATGKAHITAYQLESHSATRLGVALKESFHLSFPYLFEYGEEVYMCPETSENGDIRVYKSVDFPLQWRLEKVLMSNVSAADTMIFKWKNKWWMFTNMDSLETCDHCNELHIFYSENPLSSDWKAHAKNPIMIDADGGRNGGILCEGDRIYRISQRQGFDMYGKGSAINEIINLTESEYQEIRLINISPESIRGAVGTHHFHSNGQATVYDFLTVAKIGKSMK